MLSSCVAHLVLAAGLFVGADVRATSAATDTAGFQRRFTQAMTGRLIDAITVRVAPRERDGDPWRYSFADRNGTHAGRREWEGGAPPTVLLVDLDFDGFADLWVIRCTDGQCREQTSDVWRYAPGSRGFVYDEALSKLPNLAVDSARHLLRAGATNCGCAGSCYELTLYRVVKGHLQPFARHAADCGHYREYRWRRGALALTREENTARLDHFEAEFHALELERGWTPESGTVEGAKE